MREVTKLRGGDSGVDLIVVSGDLIQGSKQDDLVAATAEVDRQYAETRALLELLVQHLLGGKWDRVVIVPGNHDICWAHSKASMNRVVLPPDPAERAGYVRRYLAQGSSSHLRWSWADLCFFEIDNDELYESRLASFGRFLNDLPRSDDHPWRDEPAARYTIQVFDQFELCVVGFSSCHKLDHLNHIGSIHPEAIAAAEEEIRRQGVAEYRKVAVWHHNTRGGPADSDYMHDHVLEMLTALDYSLGIHGHQHRSEVVYRHSNVDESQTLAVISAASLCAGARELPPGHNRGFNIVQLDASSVSIWPRELLTLSEFMVWQPRRLPSGEEVRKVPLRTSRVGHVDLRKRILWLYDEKRLLDMANVIERSGGLQDHSLRALWIEALEELGEDVRLGAMLPTTGSEAISVLAALERAGDHQRLAARLSEPWAANTTDASVSDFVGRLTARLRVQSLLRRREGASRD